MDPKYYKNDIMPGKYDEVEFIRSPFYDLAKIEHSSPENVNKALEDFQIKVS
jgi:hypothetical protein